MIKESIILPSQGFPYCGKLDGTSVFVRPLTTRAYKDYLVSNDEEGVASLIDSCLVDCPIKAEELVYQDELAIYIKVRSISLGSTIPVHSTCPHCQTTNFEDWDLMQLECTYLCLDSYPFKVKLPDSGEDIEIILPSLKTRRFAKEEAKKRASNYKKKVSDFLPSFQAASILRVNGRPDLVDRAEWYNDLSLRDAVYIDQIVDRLQNFGIRTSKKTTCPDCKKEYIIPLSITQDFFRPSIGDIHGIETAQGTLEKGPSDSDAVKQNS